MFCFLSHEEFSNVAKLINIFVLSNDIYLVLVSSKKLNFIIGVAKLVCLIVFYISCAYGVIDNFMLIAVKTKDSKLHTACRSSYVISLAVVGFCVSFTPEFRAVPYWLRPKSYLHRFKKK